MPRYALKVCLVKSAMAQFLPSSCRWRRWRSWRMGCPATSKAIRISLVMSQAAMGEWTNNSSGGSNSNEILFQRRASSFSSATVYLPAHLLLMCHCFVVVYTISLKLPIFCCEVGVGDKSPDARPISHQGPALRQTGPRSHQTNAEQCLRLAQAGPTQAKHTPIYRQ
jgi:hypothetical protein